MALANETVPTFQVQIEAEFDGVLGLRKQLAQQPTDEPIPSVNDFVVKAAALALRKLPLANASYTEAGYEYHEHINIGVAVAVPGSLLVPTVFDADMKSLSTIGLETRRLAESVRDGSIQPSELAGGTFTISNLGMFGITALSPVVNPPQAAILGVGVTRQVLVRVDGDVVDRSLVTLTLSCDHRILYGADAAYLLATIRDLLESPLRLAL